MSELVEYETPGSKLLAWAQEAREAHLIAESLAKTSFVSDTLRGKPGEVTGAILAGHEVGLAPMAAVRSIDVIKGSPALRAVAMRALVQANGHTIRVKTMTATKAVVIGWRKGETADDAQTSEWTIDRAKRLGLTSRDNWQKQPEAMLVARATAECCRLVASDALLGLAYAAEELEDTDDAPAVKRTAKRRALEPVADSPEPPVVIEPPAIEGGPVTEDEMASDPWAAPPEGEGAA